MPEQETNPDDPRYNAVTDARDGESKFPEPLVVDESDEDDPEEMRL